MNPIATTTILQLISAAITPVAMISACSGLILGINSKHTALSDRTRQAVAECRQGVTPARHAQLEREIRLFYRRFRYTWYSLGALYAAVGCFLIDVLLILLLHHRVMIFANGTLGLFVLGSFLMVVASVLEFIEIVLANRSLSAEIEDVLALPKTK